MVGIALPTAHQVERLIIHKIDLQDADGDSQMEVPSSPSTDSDNAMFPSANEELIPGHSQASQTFAGDFSSPPASQGQAQQNANSEEATEPAGEDGASKTDGYTRNEEDVFVAGSSWNNKKARDEWQRAWTMLEDKNFSLSQYYCQQFYNFYVV